MIELYVDGSCSPMNPGGHGVAGALFLDKNIIDGRTRHLGDGAKMSNNVAEYEGLLLGLEICLERGVTTGFTIYSDSTLVINQMTRRWKVNRGKIYTEVYEKVKLFYVRHFSEVGITWEWVDGSENPADGLTRPPYEIGTKSEGLYENTR